MTFRKQVNDKCSALQHRLLCPQPGVGLRDVATDTGPGAAMGIPGAHRVTWLHLRSDAQRHE